MHRFSRMHLSPEAALRALDAADLEEKHKLAEGIALIAVVDHRRDYLAAGYSCMRDYCVERLRMSEDQTFRRIQVARCALGVPEVFECLADGRLRVATASVLVPHLRPETATDLLAAAAFKTREQVLRLLAERARPQATAPAEHADRALVEPSSGSLAPGQVNSLADLCAPPAVEPGAATSYAPGHVDNPRRGKLFVSAAGGHEVRLSLTDEEHDHLIRATALLGHSVPSGDPALVYARAMQHYLTHLEKRRFGGKRAKSPAPADSAAAPLAPWQAIATRNDEYIPMEMRREVWERDGGRCTFVGTGGHCCGSTRRLQFDHIIPKAQGGQTTPPNLRLLCRAHNQYEAERVLGKDHVRRRRELAERERARGRSAAAGTAARAEARGRAAAAPEPARATTHGPTHRARHDDIVAALRGLGFTVAEAKRGAGLADAMPDASLESCLRHALTELAKPIVARGERRARCSA